MTIPLFVPGVAFALLAATLFAPRLGRALGAHPAIAFTLIASLGIIAAATLTPTNDALLESAFSTGTCDLSRLALPAPSRLVGINDTSLNVLLFVPLGIAVGAMPAGARAMVIALAAFSLTFVVEALQLLLPLLGRSCQGADLVDNLLGLVAGAGLTLIARFTLRMSRRA